MGVYCDWVCNASLGCTCVVGIYSDWLYNAKCSGNGTHVEDKDGMLCVHNASYIVGVFRKTTTAVTLASVRERLEPLFCTVAGSV